MTGNRTLARLGRFSWTLHNVIGHPLSEIFHQLGLVRASAWVHDRTMPALPADPGGP